MRYSLHPSGWSLSGHFETFDTGRWIVTIDKTPPITLRLSKNVINNFWHESLSCFSGSLDGPNRARPGLDQAMAAVRSGDTLVVPKLDRLARSATMRRSP